MQQRWILLIGPIPPDEHVTLMFSQSCKNSMHFNDIGFRAPVGTGSTMSGRSYRFSDRKTAVFNQPVSRLAIISWDRWSRVLDADRACATATGPPNGQFLDSLSKLSTKGLFFEAVLEIYVLSVFYTPPSRHKGVPCGVVGAKYGWLAAPPGLAPAELEEATSFTAGYL